MSNIYYTILTTVADNLQTLLTIPVVVHKKAIKLESDSLPLIIIAPGPGGEKNWQNTFAKNVVYQYPITVVYVQSGNRIVDL